MGDDERLWLQIRGCGRARLDLGALPPDRVLHNGPSARALELGYRAVHWPERVRPGAPCPHRRSLTWVSAAVHDLEGARAAAFVGADILVFAPVFAPRGKGGSGRGLDALARLCAQAGRPVVALGGISPERVGDCLAAGAAGVAALSPFHRGDPVEVARAYLEALP